MISYPFLLYSLLHKIRKGSFSSDLIIRDLNFNISLETHPFCFISSSNPQEKPTYKACH